MVSLWPEPVVAVRYAGGGRVRTPVEQQGSDVRMPVPGGANHSDASPQASALLASCEQSARV